MHGGDWAGYLQEYGHPPLDFSANISPLGIPESVRRAIIDAAAAADRYPDPLCRPLCKAIADRNNLPPQAVLCGNGAADLIYRLVLARRPKSALILSPTFTEYEAALRLADCRVKRYFAPDFRVDKGFLEQIVPGVDVDMVILCEPNNPTGLTTPPELLLQILRRCRAAGALLLVDECFSDFLDDPAQHSLLPYLVHNPHLLILKAFTKMYGMAGVRLGYLLCSDPALLAKIQQAGQPWPVSSLAQAAGLAALQDRDYEIAVRRLIAAERPFLIDSLQKMGLRVVPGEANYLLFQSAVPLVKPLMQRGILLRSCADYTGLNDSWYRTAVRTHADNEQLLASLAAVLNIP